MSLSMAPDAIASRARRAAQTPEQKQAEVDRNRERRHAREAKMTEAQKAEARERQHIRITRYRAAHGVEVQPRRPPRAKTVAEVKPRSRSRRHRAKTASPVGARREQAIAKNAENQIEFETAIRRVIAKAAAAGSLTSASDWAGMSPEQILAAPLPPVRGNGWILPEYEVAAIAAALARKAGGPSFSRLKSQSAASKAERHLARSVR
jgi:hypothetical protein